MELITLLIGNGLSDTRPLPRLLVRDGASSTPQFWKHVKLQTGLDFKPNPWNDMEAQPESSDQIVKFLLCTNHWKMCYYNNWNWKNTLMLKDDHGGMGFKVDSICYNCVEHNHLYTGGLELEDRLAC